MMTNEINMVALTSAAVALTSAVLSALISYRTTIIKPKVEARSKVKILWHERRFKAYDEINTLLSEIVNMFDDVRVNHGLSNVKSFPSDLANKLFELTCVFVSNNIYLSENTLNVVQRKMTSIRQDLRKFIDQTKGKDSKSIVLINNWFENNSGDIIEELGKIMDMFKEEFLDTIGIKEKPGKGWKEK